MTILGPPGVLRIAASMFTNPPTAIDSPSVRSPFQGAISPGHGRPLMLSALAK